MGKGNGVEKGIQIHDKVSKKKIHLGVRCVLFCCGLPCKGAEKGSCLVDYNGEIRNINVNPNNIQNNVDKEENISFFLILSV